MTRFCLILALFILSACSTLMDTSTQEVRFETPGAKQSMCLVDIGDVNYRVFPPEDIILMKTDDRVEIECFADGNRKRTVEIEPILSNNTLLNIGTGFAPGFFIDEHTNAHYLYPDVISVDFTNIPYAKAEQPVYSRNIAAPKVEHIDPKYGRVPALSSSEFEPQGPLEQRSSRTFYTDTPDAALHQPSKPAPIK